MPIDYRTQPVDLERLTALADRILADYDGTPVDVGAIGEFGSVGKTTLIVVLAYLLAELGFEVEIFDLDGQGNASMHCGFGVKDFADDNLLALSYNEDGTVDLDNGLEPFLTVGDALTSRKVHVPGEPRGSSREVTLDDVRRCVYNESGTPGYGVIVDPRTPNIEKVIATLRRIHIYPNGDSYATGRKVTFYDDASELARDPFGVTVLGDQVRALRSRPHVRLHDLHGTKSLIMVSALAVFTRAITAVVTDDKTTGKDLQSLLDTVDSMKKRNPSLDFRMIMLNRLESKIKRGTFGQGILDRLEARYGSIVPSVGVRDAVVVKGAYYNREPLPMWVPDDAVTEDYRWIMLWMLERGIFS